MAAVQYSGEQVSLPANADLSGKQFTFVKAVTGSKLDSTGAQTEVALGVLQNKPTSGKMAVCRHFGGSKLKIGGTVAVGDTLVPEGAATARGITSVTATHIVRAIALEAGAANNIISVLLVGPYKL